MKGYMFLEMITPEALGDAMSQFDFFECKYVAWFEEPKNGMIGYCVIYGEIPEQFDEECEVFVPEYRWLEEVFNAKYRD